MQELNQKLQQLRRDFLHAQLNETDVNPNPVLQLQKWLHEAIEAEVNEPNAMVLSTVGKNLQPSARVVLLRGVNENKLGFFTNYRSKKGMELEFNNKACLTFFWPEIERQIRIEGLVEIAPAKISDEYFNARPRNSKIGAWSSPQSKKLKDRGELEHLVTQFDKQYPNEKVPRPEFWGGYLLQPNYFEFWQGRESRLHDRIIYEWENEWKKSRLAP